ncbi:MAG: chemotaxis protein CheW [Thiohalophilus sp.]
MSAVLSQEPFQLLRDIESRSRQLALGLPQKVEVRRTWSGIGFRLGDQFLVSPTDEVVEVLKFPSLTRVPSALSWVKGIANIRGSLIPVLDLKAFIEGDPVKLARESRVLVIEQGGLTSGLLVDEVLGLRHFFEEERNPELPDISANLKPYVGSAFKQGNTVWGIFEMRNLAKSTRFLEVASRG